MTPLKRKIEERAITALRDIIKDHPTMEPCFNERDKELSWDGYLRIYQNDDSENDKANYDDDVPVQIKGHVDKNRKFMGKERIKSLVDLEDLNLYYRRYGCLYFVLYMSEDGSEVDIFYSSLYPSKIQIYLNDAEKRKKSNKSSISIPFMKLRKDARDLYFIAKQFSFEVRKQGSGLGQIVSRAITGDGLQQVKKITATTIGGTTPYDLLKKIKTGDTVLYGTIDNSGIQYPMQIRQLTASVKQVIESPVLVDGKQYYSSFEMETTVLSPDVKKYTEADTHLVRLSKNITLIFKKTSINFRFNFNTDIMQLKKDAEFLLDLFDKKTLYMLNKEIPVGIPRVDSSFLECLHGLIEVGKALEDSGCIILKNPYLHTGLFTEPICPTTLRA